MHWVVLTNDELKNELLAQGIKKDVNIEWINTPDEFDRYTGADVFIDLLFDNSKERIKKLKSFSSKTVIINSVINTLTETDQGFIRINGWPGFLNRSIAEVSCTGDKIKTSAEKIFTLMNRKPAWTEDTPGFISARIVAMIINEAWFSLQENVSTKEEIDMAMKLGTNYPYGPFEWGEKIGLEKVTDLLNELCKKEPGYSPASLLKKQVKR